MTTTTKRHRHEQSMWIIAGGAWLWCYQCGAIRPNKPGTRWQKPSGLGGPNPAMKDIKNDRK
jgi:hypothetical protein